MYIFFGLMAIWAIFDIARGYRKAKNKQGYLIKSVAGTAVVIVALFLFGPFFMVSPIKIGYSTLKSDKVTLYYLSNHKTRAQEIFAMAQQAQTLNENFYKAALPTKILIAKSDIDMLRFGVYPKGNGGGLPWGVVIRDSKASWNIIAHEMSHKNLSRFSGIAAGPLKYPRWFDEGIASYIGEMDYYIKPAELGEEIQTGRYRRDITNWKGISGVITWIYHTFYGSGAHLIYGQTYQMVKYLFDTYGQEKVYQLVISTAGTPFEKAFAQTFGVTVAQFHQDFIESIQKTQPSPANTQ